MLDSIHEGPEDIDPAEALLREVGAHLREARRERGKEIEDVAEILRIQPGYLAGLEQGDLSVIPGRTYALGFLRSYAQYLGFDGDDLMTQIRSSVGGLSGTAALHGRATLSESRLPKVPILIVSLVALAGAYAGWAYVQDARTTPELVEEVPQELQEQSRSLFEDGSPSAPLEPMSEPAASERRLSGGPSARGKPPSQATALAPTPRTSADAALTPEMVPAIAAAVRARAVPAVERDLAVQDPAPLIDPPASETAVAREAPPPRQVVPAIASARALASARSPAKPVAKSTTAEPSPVPAREAARASATSPAAEASVPSRLAPTVATAVASEPDPATALTSAERGQVPTRQGAVPEIRVFEVAPVVPATRAPKTYGARSGGTRVVLRARSKAWVHVSSTNNDYLWVQTLRPGDSFIVPDRPDLVLWTGNAGGVEALVDGALLPPFGPDAVVVRDVSLQPRDLLRRQASSPTEDAGVSDLASTEKPPMMWRPSR